MELSDRFDRTLVARTQQEEQDTQGAKARLEMLEQFDMTLKKQQAQFEMTRLEQQAQFEINRLEQQAQFEMKRLEQQAQFEMKRREQQEQLEMKRWVMRQADRSQQATQDVTEYQRFRDQRQNTRLQWEMNVDCNCLSAELFPKAPSVCDHLTRMGSQHGVPIDMELLSKQIIPLDWRAKGLKVTYDTIFSGVALKSNDPDSYTSRIWDAPTQRYLLSLVH
jgi:hypothetical protein